MPKLLSLALPLLLVVCSSTHEDQAAVCGSAGRHLHRHAMQFQQRGQQLRAHLRILTFDDRQSELKAWLRPLKQVTVRPSTSRPGRAQTAQRPVQLVGHRVPDRSRSGGGQANFLDHLHLGSAVQQAGGLHEVRVLSVHNGAQAAVVVPHERHKVGGDKETAFEQRPILEKSRRPGGRLLPFQRAAERKVGPSRGSFSGIRFLKGHHAHNAQFACGLPSCLGPGLPHHQGHQAAPCQGA